MRSVSFRESSEAERRQSRTPRRDQTGVQAITPDFLSGDDLYAQHLWGALPTRDSAPNWSPYVKEAK